MIVYRMFLFCSWTLDIKQCFGEFTVDDRIFVEQASSTSSTDLEHDRFVGSKLMQLSWFVIAYSITVGSANLIEDPPTPLTHGWMSFISPIIRDVN